jgi:transcriptional regulator with XRE-family HTH domain
LGIAVIRNYRRHFPKEDKMESEILGLIFKAFRELKGLTQEEFANKCGVSRATIVATERQGGDLRLSTIMKIAKALEVPASLIMGVFGCCVDGLNLPVTENESKFSRKARRSQIQAYVYQVIESDLRTAR